MQFHLLHALLLPGSGRVPQSKVGIYVHYVIVAMCDKKRLAHQHSSDLLCSLNVIDGGQHGVILIDSASSFAISNFPYAPREAHDVYLVYTHYSNTQTMHGLPTLGSSNNVPTRVPNTSKIWQMSGVQL